MSTPQRLKIAVNYQEAEFPKAGYIVQDMHAWHELLFAGRLERLPAVTSFNTQDGPYRTSTGRKHHVDARWNGPQGTVFTEVMSAAALEAQRSRLEPLLAEIASAQGGRYEFVTHEELDIEADQDWAAIEMTRWLCQYRGREFPRTRDDVIAATRGAATLTLGDLINHLSRHGRDEVVVCAARLIHEGRARADFTRGFGLEMEITVL